MDSFVTVNGRKFKKGFTTGSCAAAASKAAVKMLFSRSPVEHIDIDTPAGIRLNLPVEDIELSEHYAKCAVMKDGGDDPDITTGLKIFAEVRVLKQPGRIKVNAAEGIGIVTLPGLKVAVGQPAINPVPMSMILKEVREVLPRGHGIEITLSVPGGEEIASKTYNPKLGIIGGISILGTTGIVEPMSEEAWKESLALELGVMAAKGIKTAVFVFGNYGENFTISKLNIDQSKVITVSNFVGFMLDKAIEQGFEKILMVGHMGKLVKLAAGIFHTHSRVADARMEILAAYAALEGANQEVVRKIYNCRTTDAASEVIKANRLQSVYRRIVMNVSGRCRDYTFGKITFGAVLFDGMNSMIAVDDNAKAIIEDLRNK
ncbi:MAG: cobalt-precorrin-5B (C(1))-methyltransferase CbiD [Clostridia bacterium]|nr:cobalt-precorrin-5B (C(1))-methyltransferase CbiD [Clostridia bacterium]